MPVAFIIKVSGVSNSVTPPSGNVELMWATRIVRTRSAFAAIRSTVAAPINGSYCSSE
jgi:hypothetical protein